MYMLIGIGLLWVIQASGQPIVRENVVFMPISQFSITQATWTVSFMLDLKVYDEFINKLESDVALTEEALRKIF